MGGGFRDLGSIDVRRLGLPARRARDLRLIRAWREVAGVPVASRACVTGFGRGILEISVTDARWAEVVVRALPRLAAKVADRLPDVGIRKVRARLAGRGEVLAIAPSVVSDRTPSERTVGDPAGKTTPQGPLRRRARAAAKRLRPSGD